MMYSECVSCIACMGRSVEFPRFGGHSRSAPAFVESPIDAAIGGAGSITRVARAVHVFGAVPDADGDSEPGQRRALSVHKLNVGRVPPSLLFSVRETFIDSIDATMVMLVEEEETELTSEDVFRSVRRPSVEEGTAVEHAMVFLLGFLAEGPRATSEVNAAGQEAGFTKRSLERARARLNIVAYQDGGKWLLRLPETPDHLPSDWES